MVVDVDGQRENSPIKIKANKKESKFKILFLYPGRTSFTTTGKRGRNFIQYGSNASNIF